MKWKKRMISAAAAAIAVLMCACSVSENVTNPSAPDVSEPEETVYYNPLTGTAG